jgi:hypothetical protein
MKNQSIVSVLLNKAPLVGLLIFVGASMSCMTTYDAYGRPVQSVDPGMAVAGAAAAGVLGYAIANNNDHHHGYYGGGYYGGGYYGPHRY